MWHKNEDEADSERKHILLLYVKKGVNKKKKRKLTKYIMVDFWTRYYLNVHNLVYKKYSKDKAKHTLVDAKVVSSKNGTR